MCLCVCVVVGCADLTTIGEEGAPHWMKRHGDLAVFGCNGSSATWQLKCDGDRWIGERGVCRAVAATGWYLCIIPTQGRRHALKIAMAIGHPWTKGAIGSRGRAPVESRGKEFSALLSQLKQIPKQKILKI